MLVVKPFVAESLGYYRAVTVPRFVWPHSIVPRTVRRVLKPLVPSKFDLPLEYFLYVHDRQCEPELIYLEKICGCTGTAVDVGANIGYYTYKLSKLFDSVHAFEINPELTAGIRSLGRSNVEVSDIGLSDRKGTATLFVPVLNDIPLTGWASLQPGNCPDTDEHLERPVVIGTLDSVRIADVSFLKIDVEGHELEVLNGGRVTINATRPVVLVEIKERNLDAVH